MAKVKKTLTEAAVKKFRPALPGKRDEHYDGLTPGLALRVTDKGAKSWALMYRVRGDTKARRMTLGSYEVISLSEAREQARAALLLAKSGSDPKIVREGKRDAQATDTFESAAQLFIAEHIEKKLSKRTQVEYIRPIKQMFIPRWGKRAVKDITRNDIRGIRDDIAKKRGPVAANRALAVISKFFNFCLDENMIEASPAVRIAHAVKEEPRERTLSDGELAAIWSASGGMVMANDGVGYPYGPLIRLLILTGQRRSEVGGMCWSEIDGDVWTIPRERMKTKRSHAVPLSPLALKIITEPHAPTRLLAK